MKKIQLFLMAAVIFAATSAFTNKQVSEDLYFKNDQGQIVLIGDLEGTCETDVTSWCKYEHIPNTPDNGMEENYTGVFQEDTRFIPVAP